MSDARESLGSKFSRVGPQLALQPTTLTIQSNNTMSTLSSSSPRSRSYVREICLLIPLAMVLFVAEYRAFSTPVQKMKRSLRATSTAPTRSINVPSAADSKTLPLLHETGGLVIFLHVAKTGGTTIRKDFSDESKFPNVSVRRAYGVEQVKLLEEKIDWHLSAQNTEKKTMLLEIHGGHGQPMSVFDIHDFIQRWRKQAEANNKKVFVFTLLREPTSFFVSYFNFFKHPNCSFRWCDQPLMPLTEENLLTSMVPNHQCQYLTRKWDKEYNAAHPVTMAECQSAYQLLQADADWVGTTESMSETTLPLLSFVLTGHAETGRTLPPQNQQKTKDRDSLSVHDLSEEARQLIAARSSMDQFLYDRARSDYRLDMWANYQQHFATTATTA